MNEISPFSCLQIGYVNIVKELYDLERNENLKHAEVTVRFTKDSQKIRESDYRG